MWISRSRIHADGWLVDVFFFQAEDGIRDWSVTGVQTCALPICRDRAQVERRLYGLWRRHAGRQGSGVVVAAQAHPQRADQADAVGRLRFRLRLQIGRASCRERVKMSVGGGSLKERKEETDGRWE